MRVEVTTRGLDEARRKLDRIQARFADLTPLMQQVALRMQQTNLARLQQGVQADGSPFAPLSPNYVRYTESGNPLPRPYQILVHTGKLRQGILADWTRSRARVSAGNNESRGYAYRHQYGVGVKQRRFLGISTSDVNEINVLMSRFARDAARE